MSIRNMLRLVKYIIHITYITSIIFYFVIFFIIHGATVIAELRFYDIIYQHERSTNVTIICGMSLSSADYLLVC